MITIEFRCNCPGIVQIISQNTGEEAGSNGTISSSSSSTRGTLGCVVSPLIVKCDVGYMHATELIRAQYMENW